MLDKTKIIKVKVFRSDLETLQEFSVESYEATTVMALLSKIHDTDPTFACRTSMCFKGKCGSCLVRVNGEDVFGCTALIKPGETIVVEPYSKCSVIRDVVVDFSSAKDASPENGGYNP